MKTADEIIKYLKSSDFYTAFKIAFEVQKGKSIEYLFTAIKDGVVYYPDIINVSLSWGNTIEGSNYWGFIDKQFRSFVLEKELKDTNSYYSNVRFVDIEQFLGRADRPIPEAVNPNN